jgi:hypothetical protein
MPYRFEFDPRRKIICGRLEGEANDPVVEEFFFTAQRHVAALRAEAALWDLSGVTTLDVTSETVKKLASAKPTYVVPDPPQFLVAPKAFVFGFSRMFQTIGDDFRPRLAVVHTLEEAYAALWIKPADLQPVGDLDAYSGRISM